MTQSTKKLKPGAFYMSKGGDTWLCYRAHSRNLEGCGASCIRIKDSWIANFYLDGRYDIDGVSENTLIRRMFDCEPGRISKEEAAALAKRLRAIADKYESSYDGGSLIEDFKHLVWGEREIVIAALEQVSNPEPTETPDEQYY